MNNSVLCVNLFAIKNNIKFIRKNLIKNQKLCAVVKANCYGLGARKICKNIEGEVDYFAVSSSAEFYQVKRCTNKPILILCPVYKNLKKLIERGAELTVCNFETLKSVCCAAIASKVPCKVHIAVNTGMNRFGFKSFKEFKLALKVLKKTQNIEIIGLFSHYFEAKNENYAKNQYNKFLDFGCEFVEYFDKKTIFHLSASDGIFSKNGFDMVRAGMAIYTDNVFETVSLSSKVLDLQKLNAGETAGYDAVFVAKKQTNLAVVGIGYADGIFRNIVEKGYVLIKGKKAKIVAVCMDSILVDVTDIDVKILDTVVLIGKSENQQIFVCDMAEWCDTIGYEILTRITSRVRRKYIV